VNNSSKSDRSGQVPYADKTHLAFYASYNCEAMSFFPRLCTQGTKTLMGELDIPMLLLIMYYEIAGPIDSKNPSSS
jgi:hypothetical protein